MRIWILVLSLFVFSACSDDEKLRIEGGELTVYFSHESGREEAKKVALFWKDNNFLSGRKQDIELNEFQDEFQLKLIQNEDLTDIEFSSKDRMMFHRLSDSLNAQIFTEKPVTIHLCDPSFKTKYIIE